MFSNLAVMMGARRSFRPFIPSATCVVDNKTFRELFQTRSYNPFTHVPFSKNNFRNLFLAFHSLCSFFFSFTNKFRFSLLYHLFICRSPFGKLFVSKLDISMPSACWNPEIKLHFPPAYSHLVHPVLCLEHYTGKGLLIMNLPRRIQMGSRERDCLCSEFQKAGEKVLFGFSL